MDLEIEAKENARKIFAFWSQLEDKENGGFYGRVTFGLQTKKKAYKGCILNSRILYFFSSYYLAFKDPKALRLADHAYAFLLKGIDKEHGGLYWSLDYQGNPLDTTKHTYNIAFAIYALSAYYRACRKQEVIDLALDLYKTIEEKCRDRKAPYYYLEAQKADFTFQSNEKLSENGVLAERTMNTALHILEAYTGLYEACPKPEVKISLEGILNLFVEKIYDSKQDRLMVFFDGNYNSLIDLESYGHEIEASWLLTRASEVINGGICAKTISDLSIDLVQAVINRAYKPPFIINECEKGRQDLTRVWWVQAEGVNGFINAYQIKGDPSYLEKAKTLMEGIEKFFIDPRKDSEWFWDLDADNVPSSRKDIVEPWKCPYHNGRMCFEIIRRLGK